MDCWLFCLALQIYLHPFPLRDALWIMLTGFFILWLPVGFAQWWVPAEDYRTEGKRNVVIYSPSSLCSGFVDWSHSRGPMLIDILLQLQLFPHFCKYFRPGVIMLPTCCKFWGASPSLTGLLNPSCMFINSSLFPLIIPFECGISFLIQH